MNNSKFNLAVFRDKLTNGKWFMSYGAKSELMALVKNKTLSATSGDNTFVTDAPLTKLNNIAVINIDGILYKGASEEAEEEFGLCNTDKIYNQLVDVMDDNTISAVVLVVNSPGGEVQGIEELARKISIVDSIIPVYAWTETESCSAAMWLMSQARYIGMSYSAEVGSVGVFTIVELIYDALNKNGITNEIFSAGEHKLMRSGLRELTEKEKKIIQDEVDNIYAQFKEALLSKRNIADEDLQGLTYFGRDALEKGFVDVLADNFEEFLSTLDFE